MNIFRTLYIFEDVCTTQHAASPGSWWHRITTMRGKVVPEAFMGILLFTSDISLLGVAIFIVILSHLSPLMTSIEELLFLSGYLLLILARASRHFLPSIGMYALVIICATLLNVTFPGTWGGVLFYVLSTTLFYRFPLRLSLPLTLGGTLILIASDGVLRLLLLQSPVSFGMQAFTLGLTAAFMWFGWTRRVQYRLVVRLHEVQEQLREQMKRSEELATERERTRIARDIHDVLSHSLAVLSIQVQAAKQLVARDPERLTSKLDDMATLIRESITESRHVIGLLRDAPMREQDDLSTCLQTIASTFNQRTGIHCRFEESGLSHSLTLQQRETLQQALREALTNAHRHGEAHTVWISLRWRAASVALEMRDDGLGANAGDLFADLTGENVSGHHGIQGIRERVSTLGGEVDAGLQDDRGFLVIVRIPYEKAS